MHDQYAIVHMRQNAIILVRDHLVSICQELQGTLNPKTCFRFTHAVERQVHEAGRSVKAMSASVSAAMRVNQSFLGVVSMTQLDRKSVSIVYSTSKHLVLCRTDKNLPCLCPAGDELQGNNFTFTLVIDASIHT